MAHRQLAERYAKQLNDANQRIIELETAVADSEDRLAQAKATGSGPSQEAAMQVMPRHEKCQTAAQHINELEAVVAPENAELQTMKEPGNDAFAYGAAEFAKLQEQLKAAQSSQPRPGGDGGKLLKRKRAAERIVELEKKNAELSREVTEGDIGFKAQKARAEDLDSTITLINQSRAGLQKKVEGYNKSQAKLKVQQAGAAAEEEVIKLKRLLDLETKRR